MAHNKRFNTGRWMASPFQSTYAGLRQRLIANPGVATSTVCRDAFGCGESLWRYAPKKHCAECAKRLYHSPLFDYRWLNRCPAHGTPLKSRCERCDNPWPQSSQLRDRSCPNCGVPQWDDIPVDTGLSHELLASMERVTRFVEDRSFGDDSISDITAIYDLSYAHLWDSELRYTWPGLVSTESDAFPNFQLAAISGHSQVELEKNGVVFQQFSVERVTSPLRRLTLRPPSVATWYDRLKRTGPIRRPPGKAQRVIQQCYNKILLWCRRHHDHAHQLKLGDFRRWSFPRLVNQDVYLCPFCFGLSAWWDAVTHKYFSPWQCSLPTEYWWTDFVEWSVWPDTPDRLLMEVNHDEYYRPGAHFEERYFERSLLLLFAELYQSAVHVMNRLQAADIPYRPKWDPANFYRTGRFTAGQCLWRMTDNQMIEWLWPEVDPLAELGLPPSSKRHCLCGANQAIAIEPRGKKLLTELTVSSKVDVSCEKILEIGALFHTGRLSTGSRKDSWTILERPSANYYPRFARC